MKNFIYFLIISLAALFASACIGQYKAIKWSINVEGHLKRAADANTIEMAQKELTQVIDYLESVNMTKGDTSIIWSTPDTDIGFWYENLNSSLNELKKVTAETSQLEKTNLLMKLRETLLDHGERGDIVTQPLNIFYYPYVIISLLNWLFLLLVIVAICVFLIVSKLIN